MKRSNKRFFLITLSTLFVISAVTRWSVYTFPYRSFGSANYWSPDLLLANSMSILFLVVPVLSLLGILFNWRVSCMFLVISPVLFVWFGAVPIPFAKDIFEYFGVYGFEFVTIVNFVFLVVAFLLCLNSRSRGLRADNGGKQG